MILKICQLVLTHSNLCNSTSFQNKRKLLKNGKMSIIRKKKKILLNLFKQNMITKVTLRICQQDLIQLIQHKLVNIKVHSNLLRKNNKWKFKQSLMIRVKTSSNSINKIWITEFTSTASTLMKMMNKIFNLKIMELFNMDLQQNQKILKMFTFHMNHMLLILMILLKI